MIEPGIADLDNAPAGGMAGSITAALFLQPLRHRNARATCISTSTAGSPADAPARPKGGVGQGARALLAALPEVLRPVSDPRLTPANGRVAACFA